MSVCIAIVSNQLEMVAEKLDNSKFKYKFLYDSEDKEKTIKYYNLQLLNDCVMFTGLARQMRNNKMKVNGDEVTTFWNNMFDTIFNEGRQIAIVNDYAENDNMVLVIPTTFHDYTQRSGNTDTTLNDYQLETFMKCLRNKFMDNEGINMVFWDEYNMYDFKDVDPDKTFFNMKQNMIKDNLKGDFKAQIYKTFIEAYKFRMISYYTKLRDFGLEDIMRKLNDLGYLDSRFDSELYLYEEEARRLLAKRLCAISFKTDIELLIKEGILDGNKITYKLDV